MTIRPKLELSLLTNFQSVALSAMGRSTKAVTFYRHLDRTLRAQETFSLDCKIV